MASDDHTRATLLRTHAHAFCKALLSPPPPKDLLAKFFTSAPRIHEHGPQWAAARLPFLGKTFEGADGCAKYFDALSRTLKMHLDEGSFPGPEGFVVDLEADATAGRVKGKQQQQQAGKGLWSGAKKEEGGGLWSPAGRRKSSVGAGKQGTGAVTVVGKGVFESVGTGRKWEEEFVYVLSGWDGEGRFASWEIWADPLSAWVAVQEEGEVEGWAKGGFAR